jgi:1-deoxy-D-xylulose 5-phosphate reductoisomerase
MDNEKFPAFSKVISIAKSNEELLPALVAADEVAIKSFLERKIKFTDILSVISDTISCFVGNSTDTDSIDSVEELYKNAIITANEIIRRRMQ